MSAALSLPTSTPPAARPEPVAAAAGPSPLPRVWRGRILALAGLYALVCLFFVAVWASGGQDSPFGLASSAVFLVIRLLGAAVALRKLRRAGFDPRQPAHWMLLAFGASMLLGALGTITWLTYNVLGVLVPYPSPADLAFGGHALVWAAGLVLLFLVLGTTPGEELGPWVGPLMGTWTLTVLLLSLVQGDAWQAAPLPRVALDVFYPFAWALNSALAGSLLLGRQFKRLTGPWRLFVVPAYAGAVVLLLTNIAYAITAAVPPGDRAAQYLYYNGGPLDFLFATGNYLLFLAIALLPLGQPPIRAEQGPAARRATVYLGDRAATPHRLAGPARPDAAPVAEVRGGGEGHASRGQLGALRAEVESLRRELVAVGGRARRGHAPRPRPVRAGVGPAALSPRRGGYLSRSQGRPDG